MLRGRDGSKDGGRISPPKRKPNKYRTRVLVQPPGTSTSTSTSPRPSYGRGAATTSHLTVHAAAVATLDEAIYIHNELKKNSCITCPGKTGFKYRCRLDLMSLRATNLLQRNYRKNERFWENPKLRSPINRTIHMFCQNVLPLS